jgi:hypothetical protein
MLENPSILRYSFDMSHPVFRVWSCRSVTMRKVRKISRKDSGYTSENPQRPYAGPLQLGEEEMVRASWRHEEVGGNDQLALSGRMTQSV